MPFPLLIILTKMQQFRQNNKFF